MVKKRFKLLALFVVLSGILLFETGCNDKKREDIIVEHTGKDTRLLDTAKYFLSWNILLRNNNNPSAAVRIVIDSVKARFPNNRFRFDIFYCPCDSLLYNLGVTAIDGSGNAIVPPPSPGGVPKPSGDVLHVSMNNVVTDDTPPRNQLSEKGVTLSNLTQKDTRDSKNVLAIIDTGLDSTQFNPSIGHLLWRPEAGQNQFNFINGTVNNYSDDHPGRHGTAVTALALHEIAKMDNVLPRIMVLKALDGQNKGSTFTVSCALSYAIQNNAKVINASFGYYDSLDVVDSVFRHYINNAGQKSMTIIAAAGNAPITNVANLCDSSTAENKLRSKHMFYPACFSLEFSSVITVAGVNMANQGVCRFQNHSSDFVTFGLKNTVTCCAYNVPMLGNFVTGSSFATPLVSGMAMSCVTPGSNILTCLIARSSVESLRTPFIKGGRILSYDDGRNW